MRKGFTLFLLSFIFIPAGRAQPGTAIPDRIKVFVDCSSTWCDMTYIRTEINLVDFLLDNKAADVHLLITSQDTGGGGDQYQLIFFGQNRFSRQPDTLRFHTDPNMTEFEERELLIRYIKLGLIPFIARTTAAKEISISLKKIQADSAKKKETQPTKDPWNYWVFRVGASGFINAEKVYKDLRLNGFFSANRVTEEWKTGFTGNADKSKFTYDYEDSTGTISQVNKNHNLNLYHFLVKSLNDHWSLGYELSYSQNTFSNYKGRTYFRTGIEYNIFPYKISSNKFFTLSYGFTARHNRYYDTTIYNKTDEVLFGHRADVNLTYNQKWGTSNLGIMYHNFFHNWKFFDLGFSASTNVRITGGLSFSVYLFGGLTRDQLSIKKDLATAQEVLTRQRQLASGYNYYVNLGINYRFGSKLNNFVNPRFEGNSN